MSHSDPDRDQELDLDDARLDSLEADVRLASTDLDLPLAAAIDAVVADSDFVPAEHADAVAAALRARHADCPECVALGGYPCWECVRTGRQEVPR